MDYYSFSKPKLWGYIVSGIICYAMFVYDLSRSIMHQSDFLTPFVFLCLAFNCTVRIFRWIKLNQKKGSLSEDAYLREEYRNGIVFRICSEATALFLFLIWSVTGLIGSWDTVIAIIMVVCALCFGIVLVSEILNLRRFDKS